MPALIEKQLTENQSNNNNQTNRLMYVYKTK